MSPLSQARKGRDGVHLSGGSPAVIDAAQSRGRAPTGGWPCWRGSWSGSGTVARGAIARGWPVARVVEPPAFGNRRIVSGSQAAGRADATAGDRDGRTPDGIRRRTTGVVRMAARPPVPIADRRPIYVDRVVAVDVHGD